MKKILKIVLLLVFFMLISMGVNVINPNAVYAAEITNSQNSESYSSKEQIGNLAIELSAKVGEDSIKNDDPVRAGELINYTLKLTNTGNAKIENVSVVETIPNNTTLIEINNEYIEKDGKQGDTIYFLEQNNNQIKKDNISIDAKKTKTLTFIAQVNRKLDKESSGQAIISAKYNSQEKNITLNHKFMPSVICTQVWPILRTGNDEVESTQSAIYKLNVYNLSNVEQKNVEITLNKSDLVEIAFIDFSSGDLYERVDESKNTFTVPSIPANGRANIEIDAQIMLKQGQKNIAKFAAVVKDSSGNISRSNVLQEKTVGINIISDIKATTQKNAGYLTKGEKLKYTIRLKNVGDKNADKVQIRDQFSDFLDLAGVKLNGKSYKYEIEEQYGEGISYNKILVDTSLKVNEECTIEIMATVTEDITNDKVKVSNKAEIYKDITFAGETEENVLYVYTRGTPPKVSSIPTQVMPSQGQPSSVEPTKNEDIEPTQQNQTVAQPTPNLQLPVSPAKRVNIVVVVCLIFGVVMLVTVMVVIIIIKKKKTR